MRPAPFREALLFTHRGLSGPRSCRCPPPGGRARRLRIDLLPGTDASAALRAAKATPADGDAAHDAGGAAAAAAGRRAGAHAGPAARSPTSRTGPWRPPRPRCPAGRSSPAGTEGYVKAEVTLGGVDTAALSSRTMEARSVPGLFVIGEAVDVTGWLGGYNFQWAWSSGWCAGMAA